MLTDQHVETETLNTGDTSDVSQETTPNVEQSGTQSTKKEKSYEQLEVERARAITEAVELSKERKTLHKETEAARAEKAFIALENQVLKQPEKILEIHNSDPELADQLARNAWGMSYADLIAQAEAERAKTAPKQEAKFDPASIKNLVKEELDSMKQHEETQAIKNATIDFFVNKQVSETSPIFQNVLREFNTYQPKTVSQANRLLKMLWQEENGESDTGEAGDIGSVYSLKSNTTASEKKKKGPSTLVQELGKKMGLTEKYLK